MGGILVNEKIKIVLADDNKDFCQVLKEYLSNENDIEILGIAKDGIEALDLVKKTQPDLLVLDVIMPHLDGLGAVSYTHLTLPTTLPRCRSRWSPYH